MIITIKGADFSSANIGTLSTYIISKSIGNGATYEIPNFVDKNSSATWTITLNEGYIFGTYSVTMGGEPVEVSVADNVMTISIAEVTGNVRISVATINQSTGEEDEPTIPDGPTGYVVYDSFDRADTTYGIGISDSGYKWEYPANAGNEEAIVISNGTVISKIAYPSAVCNLGAGDKFVEAIVNASNTGQILLYSRYDLQTAQDYVCVRAKNDGLTLMYKQNGTNSEIQTIPIAQLTKQYPFTLKLEVIGDTHNVYVDDEMVMSQDTTLFNDKTYVGFSINGSGNYVDDFRAEMITQ